MASFTCLRLTRLNEFRCRFLLTSFKFSIVFFFLITVGHASRDRNKNKQRYTASYCKLGCDNSWCAFRLACVAGVWKGRRERGFGARGKREGRARREGGRETPARKPLFSPSRLLIMCAKITQLWMTSCQISLAAMRLFKSYFAYCFSFVFLKQEIWSEGTIKKSIKLMRLSVEWRKSHPCLACYINPA